MHIKIVGFKCYLDAHFDFTPNSMTLLSGSTGAGKSTILEAIFWSLYGVTRNIYNNKGLSKKCSVTLQINQLIIYRQKRPELLRVTLNHNGESKDYEDEVAQQIINQAFGSRELWKSCSYIGQKERCMLLSGTANDRLSLLNQLSFNQDNPKSYISRIGEELKTINKDFITLQSEFTAELNLFSQQMTNKTVTVTLTPEEIKDLEIQISNLKTEITKLYQEVMTHERNIGSYETVCNQIKVYENIREPFFDLGGYNLEKDNLNNNIQGMKNILTNANHYEAIIQQKQSLESQKQSYETQLTNIDLQITNQKEILSGLPEYNKEINVTNEMIWKVQQQEQLIINGKKECQELGCDYDQNSINEKIRNCQTDINNYNNYSRNINIYNQLKTLKTQIGSVQIPSLDINNLENMKQQLLNEISDLKKGLELLQCPECTKPLRYVNRQLVPGERDPVSPEKIKTKESEYQEVITQINTIKNYHNLNNQILNLEKQLEGVDLDELEIYQVPNINQIQHIINRLTRIQIVQVPDYDSNYLKRMMEYGQVSQTIKNLETQRNNIILSITNLNQSLSNITLPDSPTIKKEEINKTIHQYQNKLESINLNYQNYLKEKANYDSVQTNLSNLIAQKNAIKLNPNASSEYDTCQEVLKNKEKRLENGKYGNSMVKRQKDLEIKRTKVLSMNNDLTALQKLKQNAIEVEVKQLQETVDTINNALEDFLPLFFTEPISMKLQLYKKLKTTKEVKPGLNISIKYEGVEYDDVKQLSGGEGDRVSLALILSLNSVSNSPLVLLDECISSLDGVAKEACIETIKQIENKTIICVDHEAVEGFYDDTITVFH